MLDAFDRKIAAALQIDNSRKIEDLAAEVGLSPSATHRRIARLRKDGLILAEVVVLNRKAFGVAMTFLVELTLEKVRVSEVAAMKTTLKKAPEIQQIYNVTGDVDFLLIVLARSIEHFEELSRRLFSADARIRRYRTSVVMDCVKATLAVPIETGP